MLPCDGVTNWLIEDVFEPEDCCDIDCDDEPVTLTVWDWLLVEN